MTHALGDRPGTESPQALRNNMEEVHVEPARSELENVMKCGVVHGGKQRWLGRDRRGGTWLTIEQSHLTKKCPRLHHAKRLALPVAAKLGYLYRSFADEIKGITGIAFAKKHFVRFERDDLHLIADLLQDVRRNTFKQLVGAKPPEIVQCLNSAHTR
jgi:hypothetical protein